MEPRTSTSPLIVSLPDPGLRGLFQDVPDGVEFITWDMTGPAPVADIDIVVPPYLVGPQVLTHLASANVRLVQSPTLGYDGVEEVLPAGQVFANAASVHETSTAELTVALILASQRGIPDFVRAAERGKWERSWRSSLADRTVILVGYGGVGHAIEARLLPFECTVVRVAKSGRMSAASLPLRAVWLAASAFTAAVNSTSSRTFSLSGETASTPGFKA